jgi:hypothetical protein
MQGQQTIYEEPSLLFTKSLHGGVHIHPRGWGLDFRYGDIQTVSRTVYYGIEILGMKHSKERKEFNSSRDANAYAYGKLNSMYILRPSIGFKRKLTDKFRKNGVEVSWHNSFGPSLALTKPVYLEILSDAEPPLSIEVERYDPERHFENNIIGRASVLEGFGELKFWPGVHIKSGLFFEFSPYQRQLKGIEVGMALDGYLEKIPLMAFENNNQIFHSFYINLFLGKKYNRSISE